MEKKRLCQIFAMSDFHVGRVCTSYCKLRGIMFFAGILDGFFDVLLLYNAISNGETSIRKLDDLQQKNEKAILQNLIPMFYIFQINQIKLKL